LYDSFAFLRASLRLKDGLSSVTFLRNCTQLNNFSSGLLFLVKSANKFFNPVKVSSTVFLYERCLLRMVSIHSA